MDTEKGDLTFVLKGVNLGVAYKGIPLDKPLVPCVLLYREGDSIELDTSEVKETVVDSSIPVPSNITTKSTTWNSITLTWDVVDEVSSYHIEVNGSKFCDASTTNTFTKKGFLPDTGCTFRVRTVRGNSVSEWGDAVKVRTQKRSFEIDRKTLFVGRLPDIITDEGLHEIFDGCNFKEAKIHEGKNSKYGVVSFANEEDAQKALDTVEGTSVEGKEIIVEFKRDIPEKKN